MTAMITSQHAYKRLRARNTLIGTYFTKCDVVAAKNRFAKPRVACVASLLLNLGRMHDKIYAHAGLMV